MLLRLFRVALHVYPRTFRRDYETALLQTVRDRCRFGGERMGRVVLGELVDVARSAVRMRGESPMTRFVFTVAALVASVIAALAAGPMAVVLVIAAVIAVLVGMRGSLPTERGLSRRRPLRWFAAAAAATTAGFAIPVVDGGELSEPWWSVMAVLVVAGVACAVTGVSFLVNTTRPSQPTTTP
jgi:hypothetical protein